MTERVFETVANLLAVMPAQQPWDERVAMMYAVAMKDWHDDCVVYAVQKALTTSEFRPTPAKLRKLVIDAVVPGLTPLQIHSTITAIITRVVHTEREKYTAIGVQNGTLHPLVPNLVKAIGGWDAVRSRNTEDNYKLICECFDHVEANTDMDHILINPPKHPLLERARTVLNATETNAITA